jgi:GAF domain-containing protein
VSENCSPDIAEEALGTGGSAYVVKSDTARELTLAIEAVLEGKRFVSASLSLRVPAMSDAGTSAKPHRMGDRPNLQCGGGPLISQFLASIIDATTADFGNVQLFDSLNKVLRIVAFHGLESEFLNYFETVNCDHGCACGKAMNERSRVVVTDVSTDPIFTDHVRVVLLRAKIRSVQSTPMVGRTGEFVGMVSTHYTHPGGPLPHMWRDVDHLVAKFLATIA